jgi:hypothetical protein
MGLIEGAPYYRYNVLQVTPRGQLRHDPPITLMNLILRRKAVGEDALPVLYQGGSGIIARAFDSKDDHVFSLGIEECLSSCGGDYSSNFLLKGFKGSRILETS